jgi:altronate dehydratase
MKEILTPVQWAENLNKYVKHKKFGGVLLVGLRIECYENNNLMLLIKDNKVDNPTHNAYFWVYDYETELSKYYQQ